MRKRPVTEQVWRTAPSKKFPKGQRIRLAVEEEQPKRGSGWYGRVLGVRISDGHEMYYNPETLIKE